MGEKRVIPPPRSQVSEFRGNGRQRLRLHGGLPVILHRFPRGEPPDSGPMGRIQRMKTGAGRTE